jgi:hypothetical protein
MAARKDKDKDKKTKIDWPKLEKQMDQLKAYSGAVASQ